MGDAAREAMTERPLCGDTGVACPYTPWCGQNGAMYSLVCDAHKKAPKRASDAVNPAHYQRGGTEVIDFIREQLGADGFVAYCRGNAIKYLSRAGAKDGQPAEQDLAKSRWYSQMAAHMLNPGKHKDPRS